MSEEYPCMTCGATKEEVRQAMVYGSALFAISCGCDKHGDHLGCKYSCEDLGCGAVLGVEQVCNHTVID